MAIAFVRVRPISKAKGESAGNLFAYINRVDGWEAKANPDETVIPYNSKPPAGFDTMQQLFESADTYERSNAVTAKELTIAIPTEFDINEARELMFNICQRYEPTRHLSAVIHYNDHNPHIHLLLLERQNDNVNRPKEQFFKRYNSSKKPEETGTPKFPNAAKDRREFLATARDIVESETNKILVRKDLELISFNVKNDDAMLPPAPHLGAKLHKPMLKALEEIKRDPDADPVILKHPKVIRYLKRQEAQQLLNQAEIMQESANDDRQELAKPAHQVQLKQASNLNKVQQALAEQQAKKKAEFKAANDAFNAHIAEQQRIREANELAFIKRMKAQAQEEKEAEILEQQEALAIANNAKLLEAEEALQAPTTNDKESNLEQVERDNLRAWGRVLGANKLEKQEHSNDEKQQEKSRGREM